jgi:hypothetical protein
MFLDFVNKKQRSGISILPFIRIAYKFQQICQKRWRWSLAKSIIDQIHCYWEVPGKSEFTKCQPVSPFHSLSATLTPLHLSSALGAWKKRPCSERPSIVLTPMKQPPFATS